MATTKIADLSVRASLDGTEEIPTVKTGDTTGKTVTVQQVADYAALGTASFLGLSDTPDSYTSQALKVVRVNAGATALEFSTAAAGDVVGPASAVDSNFAAFDTTTGKLIKDSGSKASDFATATSSTSFQNKTITNSNNVLGGVTMTLGSDADGDIYYRSSNVLTRLAKGTARQALRMNSGATAPEWANVIQTIAVAVGDETTAITTGTAKVTFRMPYAFKLTAVRASLTTASSSGNPAIDVNEGGVSIFSTTLTIDANEKTSTTAATAAVISDDSLADDAEITIDIDTAGTGAAGLKLYLIGYKNS